MDGFATSSRFLMNVGPEKGPLLAELTAKLPENARVLELGSFCGYSAILIAGMIGPGGRMISVEKHPAAVEATRDNVAHAGLADRVTVIHGASEEVIPTLEALSTSCSSITGRTCTVATSRPSSVEACCARQHRRRRQRRRGLRSGALPRVRTGMRPLRLGEPAGDDRVLEHPGRCRDLRLPLAGGRSGRRIRNRVGSRSVCRRTMERWA